MDIGKEYHITLPLPPSVNAMYARDKRGGTRRSGEYTAWVQYAGIAWRKQFPAGVPSLMTGRLRASYVHIFTDGIPRDIDNYCKVASDYLQGKFYQNDNQIDEWHIVRRLEKGGENRTMIWITQIADTRHVDMFSQEFAK